MDYGAIITKARALHNSGRYAEAETLYQQILKENPQDPEALQLLGQLAQRAGNWDVAEKLYFRSLEVNPNQVEVWTNYGALLSNLRQSEAAKKALDNAIALDPSYAPALKWQGAIAMMQGETEKALGFLEKAQALDPKLASVYAPITKNKAINLDDPLIATMLALLEERGIPNEDKAALHYALAYVYEKSDDPKTFFYHLREANALQRAASGDWEGPLKRDLTILKNIMTTDFLMQKVPVSEKIFTPIFIVGMPRSGSTLLEQILATHEDVFGGDELPYLLKLSAKVTKGQTGKTFPAGLDGLPHEGFAKISHFYQERVGRLAPEAQFITDKMPWNFQFIGLIAKVLPWAKVIDIRRDPVDCGFSIYRNAFSESHAQCCNFEDYAKYRQMYLETMAFWEKIIPRFVLQIHYENLVTTPEAIIRQVCEFVGLSYQDKMLDFHKTRREIRTLSLNQVLKPLNKQSIGIAKKYQGCLQPLYEALQQYKVKV